MDSVAKAPVGPAALYSDARIPAIHSCVLKDMLDHRAAERPNASYAVFGANARWTYADTLRHTRRTAAGLQAFGVAQGDTVLIALPNGADALRVWFGANYLGAVSVPVNLAYRGALLQRVVSNSGARLLVTTMAFAARLADIDAGSIARVVLIDSAELHLPGIDILQAGALDSQGEAPAPPARPILPFDTQCIIYTSGTTGPSKGVMCSYLHMHEAARAVHFMTQNDRYMVNLPMYHVSGILPCVMMLRLGGSVAIVERFRAEEFWQTVHDTQPTFVILLSVMMGYLLDQNVTKAEQKSTITRIIAQPLDSDALQLRARFGFDVYTTFNMTEISIPIVSEANPTVLGACGRLRAGVEARIVDSYDCEVADGQVGELILRTDTPWAMTHGYYQDTAATARAWRNGWFHTGDAFRRSPDGQYFFVDRMKDTIRRRGENISSFEVEAELLAHPAVREAAAVAVPGDSSESEVLAVLSLVDGGVLDPAELIAFLRPRLPYFMIPRYVRIIPQLPKTPTQKIEKHVLRAAGVSADVWDRVAAGVGLR